MGSAADSLLGVEVGHYRVVRVIGEGGMGCVYEGVNAEIGSRVAMKVIAERHAHDPELVERMFAEARAVNMIRHDGIVKAIDLLRLPDGRPVIVMDLVEGRSLRDAIQAGLLPLDKLVEVMLDVLDALGAAHGVGIVHRDLKPDNILITHRGRAKVLDFGIAKLLHPRSGLASPRTRTGVVLGTPEYMAPEQISGGAADGRADLYALGVVMFEAVTGRRPFEGATDFDVMRAHVDQPPPSPRALRPELGVELCRVIELALAKRPSDRFASPAAMADALRRAAQRLPRSSGEPMAPPATIGFDPTVPAGRLDVPTARATPGAREHTQPATAREKPPAPQARAPQPPRRARWLVPVVVASTATAGILAVVLAMPRVGSPGARSGLAGSAIGSAPADAATRPVAESSPDAAASAADAAVAVVIAPDAAVVVAMAPAHTPASRHRDVVHAERRRADEPPDAGAGQRAQTSDDEYDDDKPPPPKRVPVAEPALKPDGSFDTKVANPNAFEPTAFAPTARALARKLEPDAELTELDCSFDEHDYPHTCEFTFRSVALGAHPHPSESWQCDVTVETWLNLGYVTTSRRSTDDPCAKAQVPLPKCSHLAILGKAATKRMDLQKGVRMIWDGAWNVTGDIDGQWVRLKFRDDCP